MEQKCDLNDVTWKSSKLEIKERVQSGADWYICCISKSSFSWPNSTQSREMTLDVKGKRKGWMKLRRRLIWHQKNRKAASNHAFVMAELVGIFVEHVERWHWRPTLVLFFFQIRINVHQIKWVWILNQFKIFKISLETRRVQKISVQLSTKSFRHFGETTVLEPFLLFGERHLRGFKSRGLKMKRAVPSPPLLLSSHSHTLSKMNCH